MVNLDCFIILMSSQLQIFFHFEDLGIIQLEFAEEKFVRSNISIQAFMNLFLISYIYMKRTKSSCLLG